MRKTVNPPMAYPEHYVKIRGHMLGMSSGLPHFFQMTTIVMFDVNLRHPAPETPLN